MDNKVRMQLIEYADKYETADFINGDPSWFMHQVTGDQDREAMAFLASSLSFGSRKQFMPKIQWLRECAHDDVADWIASGGFEADLPYDSQQCFYRFFTCATMNAFLRAYRDILTEHGSLGNFIKTNGDGTGYGAVAAICSYFSSKGLSVVIPKDPHSACKRVCMFLRWMVRRNSPVDLGLWSEFIDRKTLIIPLDTHVVQQSNRLGLLTGTCASMCIAKRLTASLAEVFPEDPLRGDFALFGYGVTHSHQQSNG